MKSSIISAIAVLASFVAATPVLKSRTDPSVFKLVPASGSPAELASLGALQSYSGPSGGNLGWFPTVSTAVDVSFFIQNNAKEGIAFYSQNTALELFLRPTHGTPLYFVKLGNPAEDAAPALTLSTDFTIDDAGNFGYGSNNDWLACGSDGSYSLYKIGSRTDCIVLNLTTQYV